jgi:CIC family chloride channel protein
MTRGAAVAALGTKIGSRIERAGYAAKWLVLGITIGVIAGLGAVVFFELLQIAGRLLLEGLGGYKPPQAGRDGSAAHSDGFTRPWAIPLVVAGGALVSAVLVARFAPEAEGHGTDAAIEAVHSNPRGIRMRAVGVKMIASALTIGSGGSGGREGPTAQISAGFGSLLTRWLNLPDDDGRIAVSIGIGSGIGAIFGAPLGGAVLAGAIVYRNDFEYRALIPGLISSVTAYTVFGSIEGFDPLFGFVAADYRFDAPFQLVWFAVIGVLAGAVGIAYSRFFYASIDLANRLPGNRIVKPAVGGLLMGLLALAMPEVLGSGYGWVQEALSEETLLSMPLWVVLVLPFAKILATSLSIGSGGAGGIFGPGMVIGAFVGAAMWRLLEPVAPGIPDTPAAFVIVAMMACFGSIARAPIAVMLMVAEMTGGFTLLPGGMVAVGVAYLLVLRSGDSIYHAQRENREEAEAERSGRKALG